MSRFKVPHDWNPGQCMEAIKKLLTESAVRCSKNQYDDGAKMLIMAAQIMKEIPSIKRREIHRVSVNDKIKKTREPKKKEEGVQPQPPVESSNNPFTQSGN